MISVALVIIDHETGVVRGVDVTPRAALAAVVGIRRVRDATRDEIPGLVDLEHAFTDAAAADGFEPVTPPSGAETGPVSEFVSIKQACELTDFSESKIDRLRRAGTLPSEKVGRSRRFLRADIEALMGGER